jgi:hypothetical protein
MDDVLSIIAEPPPGVSPVESDGNRFITNVVAKVTKHVRASSVRELALRLEKNPGPWRIVQLIGHGTAGMLSLGYHWTGKYTGGEYGPVYALDSDPNSYSVLYNLVKSRKKADPQRSETEVWVLGCDVGSPAGGSAVASGRVLLFDLADLWGVTLKAPVGLIDASQFGEDGLFTGGLVDHNDVVTPGTQPPAPIPIPGPAPTIYSLIDIPVLGPLRARAPADVAAALVDIARTYTTPARLPPLAAIDEVRFAARYKTRKVTAAFVARGRFLRVQVGAATILFEPPDGQRLPDINELVRAVRRAALLPR